MSHLEVKVLAFRGGHGDVPPQLLGLSQVSQCQLQMPPPGPCPVTDPRRRVKAWSHPRLGTALGATPAPGPERLSAPSELPPQAWAGALPRSLLCAPRGP